MKKLLLTALFAGLGLSASVSAAEMPYASILSGVIGEYTCSEWGMPNVDVQYLVDGEALEIDFVNVKTKYESWDVDHEYPIYYTNVTLIDPEGEETTITAGIYNPDDIGILSLGTRASEHSGTAVTFQLSDISDFSWIKGEYVISIPEDTFVDMEGNVNPAQEIKWTNLTKYVSCPKTNITPAPKSGSISGIYNSEELKAVTLSFDAPLTYNTGIVTYGMDMDIVPEENIKFDGSNLILDLSFIPEGTVSFEIPSGFMTVGEDGLFASTKFTYVIWNGLPEPEMLTGPSSVGEFVPNIELYYGEPIEATGGEFAPLKVYQDKIGGTPLFEIPAENISIKEIPYSQGDDTPSTDGNTATDSETISVLYLDIEDLFAGLTGTYIISIPEGYVENSNHQVNMAQQIKFTVLPLAPEPVITMTDGIISIKWDASDHYSASYSINPYVILPDGSIRTLQYKRTTIDFGEISAITSGVKGIEVDLTDIIASAGPGNYELVIQEGFLQMTVNGKDCINPEIIYEFVIEDEEGTSVESINSPENEEQVIFNLQGVRIAPEGMTNGIYIINGKKVMVRRN